LRLRDDAAVVIFCAQVATFQQAGTAVGLFRKTMSISALGVVLFRNPHPQERMFHYSRQTRKYTKQIRKATRAQAASQQAMVAQQRHQLAIEQQQLMYGAAQAAAIAQIAAAPVWSGPQACPPPGWYPDPTDPAQVSWWDGTRWLPETKRPIETAPTPQAIEPPPAAPTALANHGAHRGQPWPSVTNGSTSSQVRVVSRFF
jgi:hypothetical protein